MNNFIRILIIVCALGLFGCKPPPAGGVFTSHNDTIAKMTYHMDHRTNTCFALASTWAGNSGYGYMAYVPCENIPSHLFAK